MASFFSPENYTADVLEAVTGLFRALGLKATRKHALIGKQDQPKAVTLIENIPPVLQFSRLLGGSLQSSCKAVRTSFKPTRYLL
jgi:hypothetical protein